MDMARIRKSKDDPKCYVLNGTYSEDEILHVAEAILAERVYGKDRISSPEDIKRLLVLRYRDLKNEVFSVIFLNSKHEVLGIEDLFNGTIDGAIVYPREIVRKALEYNAAAVILAHNHPSGHAEPSESDRRITRRITDSLKFIDTKVLDHVIVGGKETTSLAEQGNLI